jgi:NACalpha-BTF3-like transcription factor
MESEIPKKPKFPPKSRMAGGCRIKSVNKKSKSVATNMHLDNVYKELKAKASYASSGIESIEFSDVSQQHLLKEITEVHVFESANAIMIRCENHERQPLPEPQELHNTRQGNRHEKRLLEFIQKRNLIENKFQISTATFTKSEATKSRRPWTVAQGELLCLKKNRYLFIGKLEMTPVAESIEEFINMMQDKDLDLDLAESDTDSEEEPQLKSESVVETSHDIDVVMLQTNCSREEAISALKAHNNDIVDTIMSFN